MSDKLLKKYKDYKLCYVDETDEFGTYELYFTSDFEGQWGDDWNDTPADCNAEPPYEDDGRDIISIILDFDWTAELYFGGKHFSVQDLNNRVAPWLKQGDIIISGGETFSNIIDLIKTYNIKREMRVFMRMLEWEGEY